MARHKKKAEGERKLKEKKEIVVSKDLPIGKVIEVKLKDINPEDTSYEYRVTFKASNLIKSIKTRVNSSQITLGEKSHTRSFPASEESGLSRNWAFPKLR